MASVNNLRIIYQNWIDLDAVTVTASSTSNPTTTGVNNLKLDTKSKVWRAGSGTASLKINLGGRQIGGVILAFSNLISPLATIKVISYTSEPSFNGNTLPTSGTPISFNTGAVPCCPWNSLSLPSWGTNPVTSSNYSYGGGTYARVWLTTSQQAVGIQWLGIEITDPGNSNIEVSRLIVGPYWSPKYNTEYGVEAGIEDLSEHSRTESGDLITRRGPRFRTLNFGLQYLDQSDRKELTRLFLGNGLPKPMFVSIFPDSTGDDVDYQREGLHQIYGKMKQIPGISYDHYEFYSSNMELEEV